MIKKILIRGGGIPAGIGVNKTYVDIIRENLPGIEIINRSREKENSFNGIRTFNEDIDCFSPEVLIIHFGIDDAYHPVYQSEFRENLINIIKLARKRFNPYIILLTSHPFDNQYEMEMIYAYYKSIIEISMDLLCYLIPIHAIMTSYIADQYYTISDFVQIDYCYPNEKGHEIYANAILNKLKVVMQYQLFYT